MPRSTGLSGFRSQNAHKLRGSRPGAEQGRLDVYNRSLLSSRNAGPRFAHSSGAIKSDRGARTCYVCVCVFVLFGLPQSAVLLRVESMSPSTPAPESPSSSAERAGPYKGTPQVLQLAQLQVRQPSELRWSLPPGEIRCWALWHCQRKRNTTRTHTRIHTHTHTAFDPNEGFRWLVIMDSSEG